VLETDVVVLVTILSTVGLGRGELKHIRDDWKDEKYHYFPTGVFELPVLGESNNADLSHTIHVWYIYLHLVDLYGKCMEIYHALEGMGMVILRDLPCNSALFG